MTFPATRLGLTVEMAIGALTSTDSAAWPWVDVSSRLLAQGLSISRGQENESSSLQPASASLELDNLDGALTPNNPLSPYWPYIHRGTPVRISVEGSERAAFLPGGIDNYWTTPHVAGDNVTGPLDIRVRTWPDKWARSSGSQFLLAMWETVGNNRQWEIALNGRGAVEFAWSSSGAATAGALIGSQLVAALHPIWIGVTFTPNDGAGGKVLRIYRYDGVTPPADITTWTAVEVVNQVGTTSIFATGTSALRTTLGVGLQTTRQQLFAAQVRNGINGTVVANADFTAPAVGSTSFTSAASRVWTRVGTAGISTMRTRFMGTIDSLALSWPYGNHNAAVEAAHPSECRAHITVSDVVRRLGQGNKSTASTFRRAVEDALTNDSPQHVIGYWPAEDTAGATHVASGLPGGASMGITGDWELSSDSSLVSSAALPKVAQGKRGDWATTGMRAGVGGPTQWVVEMVWQAGSLPAETDAQQLIEIRCEGTVTRWVYTVSATGFHLRAYDPVGNGVVTFDAAYGNPSGWQLWRFEAAQAGPLINWTVSPVDLDFGGGGVYTGSLTGTLGRVQGAANTVLDTMNTGGASFGHLVVTDGTKSAGWLAGADTAWVGETAAHRAWRLANESKLTAEIIGDPTVGTEFRGSMAYSQPMGPQQRGGLISLLSQVADVDMGFISSRPTSPGFVYRCRSTLDNQAVALALDASTNAVTIPLEPTLDDQRLRNDITASSISGSSARESDQASIDTEGLYQVDLPPINGVGGVKIQNAVLIDQGGLDVAVAYQNQQIAGWLLHVGIIGGIRYPKILVDLSLAPQLLPAWHRLAQGDRITLGGLPRQHPSEVVDLIVEAIQDTMSPTSWVGALVCSPGSPYQVGMLDA